MKFETTHFKNLIINRLQEVQLKAQKEFEQNQSQLGIRFVVIDNLLPEIEAKKINEAFNAKNPAWREMSSFREKKLTTKRYNEFDAILGEITFAFQEPEVLKTIEKITQVSNQIPDSGLYAGGLSMMRTGDFLDPHIDNSHDQNRELYRRLNLLYYVSPDWKTEDGGHLELWDQAVKNNITIECRFNRLVLMETNNLSWHSVSPVKRKGGLRKCVSNYYFSKESPLSYEYFHVTSFNGRPEQKLKRVWCKVDNFLRSTVRNVKPSGLAKKDLFEAKP
ncbi:MAG: 2OG-Fe(II) oxygenase [Bdellovibrionales bacterium]|nr:2OG-Fe(II) oxygenase [Bdellovibrionales bacterium]